MRSRERERGGKSENVSEGLNVRRNGRKQKRDEKKIQDSAK